jgi:hypothetical protein
MPTRTLIHLACAAAILAGVAVRPAAADPFDKRTYFTFSGPVAVPGMTLPAGRYLFRVVDTSQRNVVQVLSEDGMRSYALFFTIRAERMVPADDPEVRFLETAADMPTAVQTWWYPGERTGYELIYPQEQARRLVQGTGRALLTTEAYTTTATETREAELARVMPEGEDIKLLPPVPEVPLGPELRGEVAPPSLQIAEPATELPVTASHLPATALAGLALLLSAAWVRSRRSMRG